MDISHDFAYLAGYIDGDGCFYIDTVKAKTGTARFHYRTVLKFASTDEEMLQYLGRFLNIAYWKKVVSKNRKYLRQIDVYEANLTGESLDKLLPEIFPYLRIKQRHCEIMMNMRSTYSKPIKGAVCKRPTEEIYRLRRKYHDQLRSINTHKVLNPSPLSPSTFSLGVPSQSE